MASMTGDSLAAITEIDFGSEGQVGITDNKRADVVEWYLINDTMGCIHLIHYVVTKW